MVRAAVCSRGGLKSMPLIIFKRLKPFLKKRNFNADEKFVFHQDSAPAHTAQKTLQFSNGRKVTYIKPSQWMPFSPDAAMCDFWL
ncbi:uncharacterized protein B4U80_04630, partial [Leptotrombidium deliense]